MSMVGGAGVKSPCMTCDMGGLADHVHYGIVLDADDDDLTRLVKV